MCEQFLLHILRTAKNKSMKYEASIDLDVVYGLTKNLHQPEVPYLGHFLSYGFAVWKGLMVLCHWGWGIAGGQGQYRLAVWRSQNDRQSL